MKKYKTRYELKRSCSKRRTSYKRCSVQNNHEIRTEHFLKAKHFVKGKENLLVLDILCLGVSVNKKIVSESFLASLVVQIFLTRDPGDFFSIDVWICFKPLFSRVIDFVIFFFYHAYPIPKNIHTCRKGPLTLSTSMYIQIHILEI